ncbi:MAG TPA: hypothetical protein VGI45_32120 [Terracidiphilus sp.]|jgi:hypothetical protein
MSNPVIPLFKGRLLILFPDGWSHGWKESGNTMDQNAKHHTQWSLATWNGFRAGYYDDLYLSPFGYHKRVDRYAPWPGTPYAPHGISIHNVPRLHPDDI